jgi:integrase
LASSGLRECEIIGLSKEDLDAQSRSIKPKNHEGGTKKSWLSFYSPECDDLLSQHLEGKDGRLFSIHGQAVRKVFHEASVRVGFKIRPKDLRDWFASQMGELAVPDRYVDAFQGRVPASILARHYSDFSRDKLQEIYLKAGLRVLE